jgi:flagellar biosynthesis chaperone FliJ
MLKMINEPTQERLLAERRASDLKRSGKSVDEIIQILHDEGINILQTILSLRSVFGFDAREAKEKVLSHAVWQEVAEQADVLHNEIIEQMKQESRATEVSGRVEKLTM